MVLTINVRGMEQTQRDLIKMARGIDKDSRTVINDVALLGDKYATNLAPMYTGMMRSLITHIPFPELKKFIVRSTYLEEIRGIGINILFNEGIYHRYAKNKITGKPLQPRVAGTYGFMDKTYLFLKKEFGDKMNIIIDRRVKGK